MNKAVTATLKRAIRRILALVSAEFINTVDILSGGNFHVTALSEWKNKKRNNHRF